MKDMQTKSTMRYHLPPIEKTVIKTQKLTRVARNLEGKDPLYAGAGNVTVHSSWKMHGGSSCENSHPTIQETGKGNEIKVSERHLRSHVYCRDIYDNHNRASLSFLRQMTR